MATNQPPRSAGVTPPRQALDSFVLVRFPRARAAELTAMAAVTGMSRSALLRHLVELGRQVMARQATRDVELVALAALLAAEQTLELLQQIVPDGRRKSLLARETAVATAQTHLEELRLQLARESTDA